MSVSRITVILLALAISEGDLYAQHDSLQLLTAGAEYAAGMNPDAEIAINLEGFDNAAVAERVAQHLRVPFASLSHVRECVAPRNCKLAAGFEILLAARRASVSGEEATVLIELFKAHRLGERRWVAHVIWELELTLEGSTWVPRNHRVIHNS